MSNPTIDFGARGSIPAMTMRRVVGCMTGTSLDGLDCALVEISGVGLGISARFVRGVSAELGTLAAPLRALVDQKPLTAGEVAEVARELALLHAATARELLGGDHADLVCIHGQTVFHAPPNSWQLAQPAPIARALRCPVVYDLRAADLAAGGQGAPITPIADYILFRSLAPVAVANLGGFCNVTVIPTDDPASITARDVCSCNQLLDHLARSLLHTPFDTGGIIASQGSVHDEALIDLEGILTTQAKSRRSLGTGDELSEWISRFRAHVAPQDLAATACEGLANALASAIPPEIDRVLLAGGGVKNASLVRAIASCSTAKVEATDTHGLPASYREAAEFAVLGALCQDKVPITLPQVTGCSMPAPLAGAWVFP